ncbi:MAG: hypothetical protein ACXV2C_09260 [Candidatus Bathyarchaeia archaeon]
MPKAKNQSLETSLIFLIFVSLFGLALSFIFVITSAGTQPDSFGLRKPLVGSVFGALCVLGTFAAIYPSSCSRVFDYEKSSRHQDEMEKRQGIAIQGHHPTCRNYSAHILRVNDRLFCATCTGFSVGAIFALVGVGLFFFGPLSLGTKPYFAMIIGAFAVSIGLLHSILPGFRVGLSRFIASAFFAAGSFLILASIEDALNNTSIDFFFVLLSVLWLVTDTALSRWDHRRICAKCLSQSCSAYSN